MRTGRLPLSGKGVDLGSGATAYRSTVSAFQLQGTSGRIPACSPTRFTDCIAMPDDQSADLRYVGTASDAPAYAAAGLDPLSGDPAGDGSVPPAMLSVGVSTYGPWRTPASYGVFGAFLDTDSDGTEDAEMFTTRLATATDDFDYFVAQTVDLRPGHEGDLVDLQLVNQADGSVDTGLFNGNALTMSVSLAALKDAGLVGRATQTDIRYWVQAATIEAGVVDTAGGPDAPMSVHWASPALGATGDALAIGSSDQPGRQLTVRRDDRSQGTDRAKGLLLFHHLNTDARRSEVVSVRTASSARPRVSPPRTPATAR